MKNVSANAAGRRIATDDRKETTLTRKERSSWTRPISVWTLSACQRAYWKKTCDKAGDLYKLHFHGFLATIYTRNHAGGDNTILCQSTTMPVLCSQHSKRFRGVGEQRKPERYFARAKLGREPLNTTETLATQASLMPKHNHLASSAMTVRERLLFVVISQWEWCHKGVLHIDVHSQTFDKEKRNNYRPNLPRFENCSQD